jgi:hypothetical protein
MIDPNELELDELIALRRRIDMWAEALELSRGVPMLFGGTLSPQLQLADKDNKPILVLIDLLDIMSFDKLKGLIQLELIKLLAHVEQNIGLAQAARPFEEPPGGIDGPGVQL